jgi:hypothetical protein
MCDARAVYNDPSFGEYWFLQIRPRGLSVIITWGKEILLLAEAILVLFLQADPRLIGTAPDYIFSAVTFAAYFIVGVKFLMLKKIGIELAGSTEGLLTKTHRRLSEIPTPQDHWAKKCANAVGAVIREWDDVVVATPPSNRLGPARNVHNAVPDSSPAQAPTYGIAGTASGTPFSNQSGGPQSGFMMQDGQTSTGEASCNWMFAGSEFGYQDDMTFWSQFFGSAIPPEIGQGNQHGTYVGQGQELG